MARFVLSMAKLQHIYDLHADDFGLSGSKDPKQLERLREAIDSHLDEPSTQMIAGQYRGRNTTLHFNVHTRNVVVTDKDDTVIAAFKTSPAQAAYIMSIGRLN